MVAVFSRSVDEVGYVLTNFMINPFEMFIVPKQNSYRVSLYCVQLCYAYWESNFWGHFALSQLLLGQGDHLQCCTF